MTVQHNKGEDRLEELFHCALQLPEDQRRHYLVEACRGDDELLEEILGLVSAHAGAPECLDQPGWSPDKLFKPEDEELSPGSSIGSYVVGHLLGEGGMGSVYLAEQCEPLQRKVALKVIKLGMDTREVLSRFNAERQVLARLSHPSIASVYDAGVTPRGRPFFVMEFVDGETITSYCDHRRLGLADRLRIFELTCDAVQHAHQKGVVHRDLKPGNILVSDSHGHPLPKIIDFGVAKAIGGDRTQQTSCTRVGQMIGTPGYMSPEQAVPDSGIVDTRTDVYSLGVLLHELLVGALPRDARRLEALGAEGLARELSETEVESPSQRLAGLGTAGKRFAARRDTDVRALVRALRGDLDWIVLKAVSSDPDDRYASASELSADVRNHLDGLPITAGPPGVLFRAARMVASHRSTVASAAMLLACLLSWPTVLDYLRGEQPDSDLMGAERITTDAGSSADVHCATCQVDRAAAARSVYDTVLVYNAGRTSLAVGDLVELVAEDQLAASTTFNEQLVMAVSLAQAGSGRAPLGPVSTALSLVEPESGHTHAVSGTIAPGAYGQVVVRGTLALIAVDDSGGSILANQPLVVARASGRAAAVGSGRESVVVGTALQDWYGPGEGLIRAFIAPTWPAPSSAASASKERPLIAMGGVGLAGGQADPLADADDKLDNAPAGSGSVQKMLPATVQKSSDSSGLVGQAAAVRAAPEVGELKDGGLLDDIVDGGTLSGASESGTGGSGGHGGILGMQGQTGAEKGGGVATDEEDPAPDARDERVWGDLDGDGLQDVIITADGETTVLANQGQGLFNDVTPWAGFAEGFVGGHLTLADLDGDDVLDLLSLDETGRLTIHLGRGNANFVERTLSSGVSELPPLLDISVIDPEDDGAPDLELAGADGELFFLLNDGRAHYTTVVLRQKSAKSQGAPDPTPFGGAGPGGLQQDDDGSGQDGLLDFPSAGGGAQAPTTDDGR
jgi:serine/threonine protein kinase